MVARDLARGSYQPDLASWETCWVNLLGEEKLHGLIQMVEPVDRVRCLFYALGLLFCSELLI